MSAIQPRASGGSASPEGTTVIIIGNHRPALAAARALRTMSHSESCLAATKADGVAASTKA